MKTDFRNIKIDDKVFMRSNNNPNTNKAGIVRKITDSGITIKFIEKNQ